MWEKLYTQKIKEANKSAEHVGEYLSGAEQNRSAPVPQIQDQAAPLVALSAEISAARHRYWAKAMQMLTSEQRRIVTKERETDYAVRQKALQDAVRK
ncbi:MAG: hypothetical protein Q7N50_16025 [Armatimonadota bacterium]|nr:hypothetical protein [Armatimonadota bacterium]